MNLKQKLFILIFVLFFTTLIGGVVMIWYTYHTTKVTKQILQVPLKISKLLHDMQYNLLMQKGTVTYFSRDKDDSHLKVLAQQRNEFIKGMELLKEYLDPALTRQLAEITLKYAAYVAAMDRVISYYAEGKDNLATSLHFELRKKYQEIVNDFNGIWGSLLEREREMALQNLKNAKLLRIIASIAILFVVASGIMLAFLLLKKLIIPLEEVLEKINSKTDDKGSPRDLKDLKAKVERLMEDVDFTQEELERSRETLLQAEKMALVGKLAASTAHTIRNPLTSVKMRLYSLSRSLQLTPDQKEDLDVISQEIAHIDHILQNFLEFSRPPKLKPRTVSPSDLVDELLELLYHKIEAHSISIRVLREGKLPQIMADPELLKEAMTNIIMNACEAMEDGGELVISEKVEYLSGLGKCISISFSDNGPGVPEELWGKVFQPFFTTKEHGTGLGLSIANRILHEHGGKIEFMSKVGEGSTFTIYLPTLH